LIIVITHGKGPSEYSMSRKNPIPLNFKVCIPYISVVNVWILMRYIKFN
jgi:hypothetical protein